MYPILQSTLFQLQTSIAIAISVLATQEKRHGWVPVVMVSGLVIWILLSFILLLVFRCYLVQRAPLSVFAIVGPLVIWAIIVDAKEINLNYAGLFTPIWIASGLNILVIHDSKKHFTTERQKLEDEENP
ncbi:hypothetical protein RB213_007582 [Colletotrichum asianum]